MHLWIVNTGSSIRALKEGKLEKTYDSLSDDYEDSKAKSEVLSGRIAKIDTVANDLFKEWRKEAISMDNKKFKSLSLVKLSKTKTHFKVMLKKMRGVEYRLKKVLKKLI